MVTMRKRLEMAETAYFFAFMLLLIFSALTKGQALLLDVHLSLRTTQDGTDLCPYRMALESNLALRQLSQREEIDFFTKHTAHITLYQADLDFNNTDVLLNATAEAIGNLTPPCLITWPSHAVVLGDFAMYFIPNESCLQRLSNVVVLALNEYVHRPPPVPDWVYALPRKARQRALELIERYGSPNVLDRFQPHVTVGFDKFYPPYRRREALNALITPPDCQARLAVVTIARVGVGGSVLQNGILGRIPLNVQPDPNSTIASAIS